MVVLSDMYVCLGLRMHGVSRVDIENRWCSKRSGERVPPYCSQYPPICSGALRLELLRGTFYSWASKKIYGRFWYSYDDYCNTSSGPYFCV